jgi:glycosyltransferase involved in cell wall biosynthesis
MKKMKIALVYDAIYPYIKGGGEKRFDEIGKRLAKKGHQVHLYGMKLWEGHDVIQKEGIYLHSICPPKPLYTKDGRRSMQKAIFFGIHCLKLIKEDFDVIDCCGFPYFSLFSCKLDSLIKKKLFSTWHEVWGLKYWQEYLGRLSVFGYLIEKLSLLIPSIIISVSKSTARRIKDELGLKRKIYVISSGIDFNRIQQINAAKEKIDVIYAGRLMDFKHIYTLIKAIHLLKEQISIVKCLVIREGPKKKRLEVLVQKLNLKKNIKFLGFLENDIDVYALMKLSKVFVLPSTREGFGIVVGYCG